MKKIFILFIAILFIFTACTPMYPAKKPNTSQYTETKESSLYDAGEVKNCRITGNNVIVKAGTGNSFKTIGSLNKNDVVSVLEKAGDWYVVKLDNNQIGCVNATNATPVVKEGEDKKPPQTQQQQTQPTQAGQQNPQTTAQPTNGLSANAQQMVNLVNQERKKNGLPALTVDLELARVAEVKSQDMADNNYFSHYSPNYGSPFDMMKTFGIDYLQAGENIAGNATVDKAHTALMNSSGHRKNILSPDFTHIGIGVKSSSKYGNLFTQMFISKPK